MEEPANTPEQTIPGTPPEPGSEAVAAAPAPSEQERLTDELNQKTADYDALQKNYDTLLRRTSMDGKVADMNLALKVLDPARHLHEDGTVNVQALYADFPLLTPTELRLPTAPSGGGGPQFTHVATDLDAAASTGNPTAINSALDALLKGEKR